MWPIFVENDVRRMYQCGLHILPLRDSCGQGHRVEVVKPDCRSLQRITLEEVLHMKNCET